MYPVNCKSIDIIHWDQLLDRSFGNKCEFYKSREMNLSKIVLGHLIASIETVTNAIDMRSALETWVGTQAEKFLDDLCLPLVVVAEQT